MNFTNNQKKYIKTLDAWADAGSPSSGPVWDEFQMVWNSLSQKEQEQISNSTGRELEIEDPSEDFDEYKGWYK